jgi:hypothetical protein
MSRAAARWRALQRHIDDAPAFFADIAALRFFAILRFAAIIATFLSLLFSLIIFFR